MFVFLVQKEMDVSSESESETETTETSSSETECDSTDEDGKIKNQLHFVSNCYPIIHFMYVPKILLGLLCSMHIRQHVDFSPLSLLI